jgi:RNA polymerase sigma factor (sigma-70 family)
MLKSVNQEREVRLNAGRTAGRKLHEKAPSHRESERVRLPHPAPDALERKEIIALLAERISQLPELQKKVLAMYYHQNMQLSEIAPLFGVTDSQILKIRGQALAVLRKYLAKLPVGSD